MFSMQATLASHHSKIVTYSHYLLVNLKILFRFFKKICRGKTANRCGKLKFSSFDDVFPGEF